eukprot:TRINITY_DN3435_c0_g1_i1.p1 TRINITY_DN3435_c0_g1~~TRINITY_DN3435_c0_g1_i1.p1  ORF type:complete len:136 (-),score=8.26 TRINITY_DN3435_c0_g1_i1:171-578(-)
MSIVWLLRFMVGLPPSFRCVDRMYTFEFGVTERLPVFLAIEGDPFPSGELTSAFCCSSSRIRFSTVPSPFSATSFLTVSEIGVVLSFLSSLRGSTIGGGFFNKDHKFRFFSDSPLVSNVLKLGDRVSKDSGYSTL